MKRALIIFVRNPVLGKVKTRIAKDLGDDVALAVYRKLLQHTLLITQALDADKFVYYADDINTNDLWNTYTKRQQVEGDLGERMNAAFTALFDRGYTRIAIIGSDCYELTSAIIEQGFAALEEKEVVVGPSVDGGYYLLGLQRMFPAIFNNINWSTATVFSSTLEHIKQEGSTYALLRVLNDVDNGKDCKRHSELIDDQKALSD